MNEYFDRDGHFTEAGFSALLDGVLTEKYTQRAAEHLAQCDRCLLHYTNLLTDDRLLEPERPLADTIIKRLRLRIARVFANRYMTLGVAACLALVFWIGGIFQPVEPDIAPFEAVQKTTAEFSEKTKAFTEKISDALSQLMHLGGKE